ncbi:probable tyrosyl-DNA phosphodiesterase [Atheta coriaria]|uniref:probable tyrosyl-DNA phosphodiesterase n=1 Tax=Dalotia coriaria TaxID=877792 RepID=UPI0031F3BE66
MDTTESKDIKVLTMRERLELCAPFNLFFTTIPEEPKTTGYNCIAFPDLICPSLGILEKSLQINFMLDIDWLIDQYEVHNLHTTPITVIWGRELVEDMSEYISETYPNVKTHKVTMENPFGLHHSKIGIYKFGDDTIRIVISSANLYFQDWNRYNQGLWMSPPLPKMAASKHDFDCAGPTDFKIDLLTYLESYNINVLTEWIQLIKRADFSSVKVYFICSIPGNHHPGSKSSHFHRVGDILSKQCSLPSETGHDPEGALSWGIIAQASSLGLFGDNLGHWLEPILMRALSSHQASPYNKRAPRNPTLSLIYPTDQNVENSIFGRSGGCCLPYKMNINEKQEWLRDYLHVWKADNTGRSEVMPHIKSYMRVSPCLTKLAWCLITSGNISKAAWGCYPNRYGGSYIRSYEAGVMFLPHMFDDDKSKQSIYLTISLLTIEYKFRFYMSTKYMPPY